MEDMKPPAPPGGSMSDPHSAGFNPQQGQHVFGAERGGEIETKQFQEKENDPPPRVDTDPTIKNRVTKKKKSGHQCELCGKTFQHESRLKRHVATHTGADKVQCEICSRILGARDQYVVHMKRLHKMDVTKSNTGVRTRRCFACDICGKIFINNYKLRRHMNVHTGEDKSQCSVCFKWIATKAALVKHMERHNQLDKETKSVECRLCSESLPTVQELLVHLDIHPEDETYVCSICEVTPSSNKSNTEEGSEQSNTSNNDGNTSNSNKNNGNNNSNTENSKSNTTFSKKEDFILHLMSAHPTIKYDKLKPKKLNECHLCGKSFQGHSALLRHINYHTREYQVECTLCGKQVANKDHLPLHMSRYHPDLYERIKEILPKKSSGFHCEYCGEKFPGRHKLDTHRKAHEMFQCPLCPTRLQTEDNWRKHMTLHVSSGYTGDVSILEPLKESLVPQFEPETKEKQSKGDFILALMQNDFKDCVPGGLRRQGGSTIMEYKEDEFQYKEDVGSGEEEDYSYKQDNFKEGAPRRLKKKQVPSKHNSTSNVLRPSKRELSNDHLDSDFKDENTKKSLRSKRKKRKVESYNEDDFGEEIMSFSCDVCNKSCSSFSRLQRHMNSHTGLSRVKCKVCRKSISNKDHLDLHIKRKHPDVYERLNQLYSKKEAGFPCEGCGKKFESRSKLERHIKVHATAYICPLCPNPGDSADIASPRFHSAVNMRKHLSTVHLYNKREKEEITEGEESKEEKEPEQGGVAEKDRPLTSDGRTLTSDDLETLLESSKIQIKQEVGDVKSKGDWILEIMNSDDQSIFNTKSQENNESDFKPPVVSQEEEDEGYENEYDDSTTIDRDVADHLKEDLASPSPPPDSTTTSLLLPSAKGRGNDEETVHANKFFSCNFCSKELFLHEDLKAHVLAHIAVRPFECNACNQTFTTRKWLTEHRDSGCSGQNRLAPGPLALPPDLTCLDCDIYFENSLDLSNHTKLFHEEFVPPLIKEEVEETEEDIVTMTASKEEDESSVEGAAKISNRTTFDKSFEYGGIRTGSEVHCKQETAVPLLQ